MENWIAIANSPNYAVSDLGNIKRITRGRRTRPGLLRKQWNMRGYRYITLHMDGKNQAFQVHRLVMAAFVGHSELQVNHKNGDRSDNRLANLEYVTGSQNQQHSLHVLGTFIHGSKHHQAKLTEDAVREIRSLRSQGFSGPELAKRYGVSSTLIYYVLQKKWWKHVE